MPNDDVTERARKIVRKFPQIEPYVIAPLLQECIAQALTEAHDAGMEKAAGIADAKQKELELYVVEQKTLTPMACEHGAVVAGEISAEIRRAKSKPGV